LVLVACLLAFGQAEPVWITVNDATLLQLQSVSNGEIVHRQLPISSLRVGDETIHILKVDDSTLVALSEIRHHEQQHGPGFIVHSSFGEAVQALQTQNAMSSQAGPKYPEVKGDPKIKEWLKQASASNVAGTITHLSTAFKSRHYQSESGVAASKWLQETWQGFAGSRKDVTVELFKHTWKQPSVILTIQGTDPKAGTVVVGGHMDSSTYGGNPDAMVAPGADDNASGTSSVTEALRVLLANDFKPRQTVKFMGYAAEEAGLLGSRDIAQKFKSANVKITGVLQLDMTNFKGSAGDLYVMTGTTTAEQDQYLVDLAKEYLPELTIAKTSGCSGCSDHASWLQRGYRASFIAESEMRNFNKNIHSAKDTIQNSDPTGQHALKYAKLALVFAAELANAADLE